MSTDVTPPLAPIFDSNSPKNVLFSCALPICATHALTILPPDTAIPAVGPQNPVRVPNLRYLGMIDARKTTIEYRTEEEPPTPPDDDDQPSPHPLPPPQPPIQPPPTPPPTPQETRLGIVLRRVSPKKRELVIKKISDPTEGVVLRRADRNGLLPPSLRRPRSPPPKRRPYVKPKPPTPPPPPPPKEPTPLPPPPPSPPKVPEKPAKPVNLLLNRPPVEMLRIEGDKIIIIRRIPRRKPEPPAAAEPATNGNGHGGGHHKHHHHHYHGEGSAKDKKHHRHPAAIVPRPPFKTICKQVTTMSCVYLFPRYGMVSCVGN